jgi:hypothetical protein
VAWGSDSDLNQTEQGPNQTEQGHTSHNADQTHGDNLKQVSDFFCRCICPYEILLACVVDQW